jgi:hypothetical protein
LATSSGTLSGRDSSHQSSKAHSSPVGWPRSVAGRGPGGPGRGRPRGDQGGEAEAAPGAPAEREVTRTTPGSSLLVSCRRLLFACVPCRARENPGRRATEVGTPGPAWRARLTGSVLGRPGRDRLTGRSAESPRFDGFKVGGVPMLTGLAALVNTDWSRLHHAYGRATDTPGHLRALLREDVESR